MRHEGNDEVLLFESEEDEEALLISCRATKEGGLVIHQMSEGDLTAWCFEESPHEVEVTVSPRAIAPMLEYLHAEDVQQLSNLLAAAYSGYDASIRIRALMRRLGVAYEVSEHPIVR